MSFTDHKITQFQHKVADLPDQPTLPPDELKARFDSSAEELRVALGAVCDDAARLEARVSGIVAETFGDTIPKSMLSDELQDEIDAKAVETSVASRFSAEQNAREAADTAESTARQNADTAMQQTLGQQIAQKCEIYCGSYTGNGSSQVITLGFEPKAVLVMTRQYFNTYDPPLANLAMPDLDAPCVTVLSNGFEVRGKLSEIEKYAEGGNPYRYIAFK